MNEKIKEMFCRYFEKELSVEEEKLMKKALQEDEQLQNEYVSFVELQKTVSLNKNLKFSDDFEEKVMKRIVQVQQESDEERFYNSLFLTFKRISLVAAVFLCFIVSFNMISNKEVSINSALSISESPLEQVIEPEFNFFEEISK